MPAISHVPHRPSSSQTSISSTARKRLVQKRASFLTGSLLRQHHACTETQRSLPFRGRAVARTQKAPDTSDGGHISNGINRNDPRVALAVAIGRQLTSQAEKGKLALLNPAFLVIPPTANSSACQPMSSLSRLRVLNNAANPVPCWLSLIEVARPEFWCHVVCVKHLLCLRLILYSCCSLYRSSFGSHWRVSKAVLSIHNRHRYPRAGTDER